MLNLLKKKLLILPLMLLASFFILSCSKKKVSNFVTEDKKAYLEVGSGADRKQIITEYGVNYKVLLVFDAENNLEIFKLNYLDSTKKNFDFSFEIIKNGNQKSTASEILENNFIQLLKSNKNGFAEWQTAFSSFSSDSQTTKRKQLFVDKSGLNNPLVFVKNEKVVFRMKDIFCTCKRGAVMGICLNSALRCAMDNICDAWDCIVYGEWTPECNTQVEQAKVCLGMYEG